ncbi:tRNA-Thr(GGU) m(6)t(6)A37 methyltransferase TsaA [Syntrophus gentianae]|uniref:tRNA-Thr(GGU) m(6)t(6)A37 methyltransferase TsaA n=1 Tax=Syntrophus gentianae TaxID=43775 RepID=A0A1H8BHN9_9BACT|nr:tRNA (N6-threonylcarbamoyladenosine(37)-N6)-methyltransferase TrmO [Syntrophus gentianae]SEM82460.1 tRNA-Thr(GGU) m(6)t(6)A37 methyltransferase TsaA [Syntrophus gentianae]
MIKIQLKPVGFISSPVTEQADEKWGGVISRVLLQPEYIGALSGLEDFSHAMIITYLHQAKYEKEKHLQRRPRDLDSMPKIGIFSQRAKDRPNPIGVTTVKIITVKDDYIEVQGLDAINGTPILDIKPYYPHYDKVDAPKTPEWVDKLMEKYF